eukprot:3686155-Rhodomonas_salina.1
MESPRDSTSPSNPALVRLQMSPGSPLSPGGRDGAAALISLFNRGEPGSWHLAWCVVWGAFMFVLLVWGHIRKCAVAESCGVLTCAAYVLCLCAVLRCVALMWSGLTCGVAALGGSGSPQDSPRDSPRRK